MRDEDPPARGLAELMAAARTQADAMRPKESWWRKSLALLVRPPVLAAATVIVIVGGAIALNRKGVDDASVPVAVEQGRAEPGANRADPAKDEAPSIPAAGSGSAATADDQNVRTEKPTVTFRPPPRKNLDTTVAKETVPPPPPPPPPPTEQPRGGGEEGLVIAGDAPKPKAEPKAEKKPVEPAPAQPDPKLDSAEADFGGRAPTADRAPRPAGSPTDQLVKQAELAASRNDCPAVRATAERVKKADPTAYKSRLTTKPAIARCLK
jgi:hypothetical protein